MPTDGDRVVIAISIGNPNFDGSCLMELLLRAKNAKEVYFELGCSLQRHNLEIDKGLTPDAALAQAISDGDEWWAKNKETIERVLGAKYKGVQRWDQWRLSSEYTVEKKAFDGLCNGHLVVKELLEFYDADSEVSFVSKLIPDSFEQAMFDSIKSHFKNRNLKEKPPEKRQKAIENCYEYLAEETVIIYKLWQRMGYNSILYPGKITDILQKGYNEFVKEHPDLSHLLQWRPVNVRGARKFKTPVNEEKDALGIGPSFFGTRLNKTEITEVLRHAYDLFAYLRDLDRKASSKSEATRFFLIQILTMPANRILLTGCPTDAEGAIDYSPESPSSPTAKT